MSKSKTPIGNRFFKRVAKSDSSDFWVWLESCNNAGFGEIREGGRRSKKLYAHRVSWELHYGPIPSGLNVLHKCDFRKCVNPQHLILGTASDTAIDCLSKNRKPGRTKLETASVKEIRSSYSVGTTHNQNERRSAKVLMVKHGVSYQQIRRIVKGMAWSFL